MTTEDLYILGAGDLGARVAALWRSRFPAAKVVGETLTSRRHPALRALGCTPRLRGETTEEKFPFVLVALPPSASAAYAQEVARAALLWDGSGTLLHISSSGIYAENQGGEVDEHSAPGTSARARTLAEAEAEIQRYGGTVLRLAGLYARDRGPHLAYLARDASPLNAEGWLNLIHYDDAATLAARILERKLRGIFLGCDGQPVRRGEFARTLRGDSIVRFGNDPDLGKKLQNTFTRTATGWEPRWKRFSEWYSSSSEVVLK